MQKPKMAVFQSTWSLRLSALATLMSLADPSAAFAQDLDPHSKEALTNTQDLLTNRAVRQKEVEKGGAARGADAQVNQIAGGDQATADAIYQISSDVFADIAKEAGGDPVKMQQILAEAQKDPKGFAARWSPKNRAALKEVAEKIDAKRAPAAALK